MAYCERKYFSVILGDKEEPGVSEVSESSIVVTKNALPFPSQKLNQETSGEKITPEHLERLEHNVNGILQSLHRIQKKMLNRSKTTTSVRSV